MTSMVTQDVTTTKELLAEYIFASGNELKTDSRWVAKAFGKRHADVIRAIKNLKIPDEFKGFAERNFAFCYETSELQNGKPQLYCEMTKDGFVLLVMGFTGEQAMFVKLAYIEAFNMLADKIIQIKQGMMGRWMNAKVTEQLSFAKGSYHGKGLRQRGLEKTFNHQAIAEIESEMQPDLFHSHEELLGLSHGANSPEAS